MPVRIPEHEFSIEAARSGGPGGQNVNKTNTKAVLKWDLAASGAVTAEEKARLAERLASRLTRAGVLVLHCSQERSLSQNIALCKARAHRLVNEALVREAKRVPTKPSRASKERRLEEKTKEKRKKARRGRVEAWE